jgi:CRISPR type III-B/RAMP module RAMP protein Cmr1
MKTTYQIQAITPIFSYGADPYKAADKRNNTPEHKGTPEIRPASIRGQLRWWMEILGYSEAMIGSIFGSTAGENGMASKVVIRVSEIQGNIGERRCTQQHGWSNKTCYLPNAEFDLIVVERLGGLNVEQRSALSQTIDSWLLMGTLGGRGTRAAGSLNDTSKPLTESQWAQSCAELLKNSKVHLRLGRTTFQSETDAREVICDTLKEEAFYGAQPLGGIHPRKTSPLRMRVVRFSDADPQKPYRIAALWTEANEAPLEKAIQTLKKGNGRGGESKPIGAELESALRIR